MAIKDGILNSLPDITLAFDSVRQVAHLSQTARQFFGLNEAQEISTSQLPASLNELTTSSAADSFRELTLVRHDGVKVSVLALCSKVKETNEPEISIIQIYELNSLEPLFEMVRRSNRLRALIVLACSSSASTLPPGAVQALKEIIPEIGTHFYEQLLIKPQKNQTLDLQRGLSLAIDIADQLISPSIKISLEQSKPYLVSTERAVFLRIVSHLLLEASDFCGFAGTVSVGSAPLPEFKARLTIKAVRQNISNETQKNLLAYIKNRMLAQLSTGATSINLQIIFPLLEANSINFMRREGNDELVFTAEFPLAG